jgi:hypothetical protein
MAERFLVLGIFVTLASVLSYFTKLNELSVLQGLHHAILVVMMAGTLLALWGCLLLLKFRRDES